MSIKKRFFRIIMTCCVLLLSYSSLEAQWVNNQSATNVIGASNFTALGNLSNVQAYYESPVTGKIFIATGENIQRYSSNSKYINGAVPEVILLGSDLQFPIASIYDIVIDEQDNLWLTDVANSRILRYPNASTASNLTVPSLVLGQNDIYTGDPGQALNQFFIPYGIAIKGNRLYVADYANHRISIFNNADALNNGAAASVILGTGGSGGVSNKMFSYPTRVHIDHNGNLWVTDSGNNRVLKFTAAQSLISGASASLVLGAPDFDTVISGADATTLSNPVAVIVDGLNNVYVADSDNSRVLVYKSPVISGAAADFVLGQVDFSSSLWNGLNASSMHNPRHLFLRNNTLVVTSTSQKRVLIFTPSTTLPIQLANFNAKYSASGRIEFDWETVSESNNDYFELEVSSDGKKFSRIATINSQALLGNSTVNTKYTYTWNISDMSVATFGFFSLLLLPALRRRWTKIALVLVVVASFLSCEKDLSSNSQRIKYAKLMQIDQNGTRNEVKIIEVK